MKTLLVVGDDKFGRKLINNIEIEKFEIILDKSSSIKRILKLIVKKRISLSLVCKMTFYNFLRKKQNLYNKYQCIKSNRDLIEIIKKKNIEQVVLFRGGLIINTRVLNLGIRILNIHCAKIPEYGGIGVIHRALQDKAHDQEATLHIITSRIDEGEVITTEKYQLDDNISYGKNEDLAYNAGIRLFIKSFN